MKAKKTKLRRIRPQDAYAASFLAQVKPSDRKRVYDKYIRPAMDRDSAIVTEVLNVGRRTPESYRNPKGSAGCGGEV
jgi:hypothetical protein